MTLTKNLISVSLGLYLTSCGTTPTIVEETTPVVIAQYQFHETTLGDLLDETSAVRTAEHALIMVYADWCQPCHDLIPYFEEMAQYVDTNSLNSEQLYLGLVRDFNGDLGGVLDNWVEVLPTILYLQSENGNPNREAARIEQGGLATKLWIAGIVNGLINQYQQ